jgi:hypothetical protein
MEGHNPSRALRAVNLSYHGCAVWTYEAPIRRDGYGDTRTAIRDTAISKNSDSAIRRVYV